MKGKEILKNEYVKTAITLIIILAVFVAFWFGIKFVLRTEYPFLAVASGSMSPTLNAGDLIVVQGVPNASEIKAGPNSEGDIIVFHKPKASLDAPDELIVHRAIDNATKDGRVYFRTKGDNPHNSPDNWQNDYRGEEYAWNGMVSEKLLVGKVIYWIPRVGHVALFIRTPLGMILIVLLLASWVLVELVYSLEKKRKEALKAESL